jgi:hypothetical protein
MPPRTALAAAMALVSTAAAAAPPAFTLELSGQVPTLCRVEARLEAGTLEESCNHAGGYEVYAQASPELAGAMLVVDGAEVTLPASGAVRISHSDHAGIATRSLALRGAAPGGALTFRIVPL